jgi:hypothetical protein
MIAFEAGSAFPDHALAVRAVHAKAMSHMMSHMAVGRASSEQESAPCDTV